jgi:hypothetical protein
MNETNSTMTDITVMGNASKIDYKKLPEVAYFRVQSRGATGTLKDLHDRKVGAWALLVSCKDGKGLRLMTDVAYEFGMKIKGEFKTREEAIEAGKKAIEKWGKLTATVEKKVKKSKGIEELIGEMTAEAKQELIKKLMAA